MDAQTGASLTGDEAGDDERQYEHLENAHEDVTGERDEHDHLL